LYDLQMWPSGPVLGDPWSRLSGSDARRMNDTGYKAVEWLLTRGNEHDRGFNVLFVRALNGYYGSYMHLCKMCFSRVIHYRHVSTTVAVVFRVIYKITRSPNRLLKCISEPLSVTKHVSNFPRSHWKSAY